MDASFWQQQLSQFIFVLANNADTVFLGTLAILAVSFGPVGRAVAARLRGRSSEAEALKTLSAALTELQEHADFTERILTELQQEQLPRSMTPRPPQSRSEQPTPV